MSNIVEFTLTVSLNNDNIPEFNYSNAEGPATGSLVINTATTIRYNLVDNTNKGLTFSGAAFTTPFNNVIDDVVVSEDKMSIDLIDSNPAPGKTGFRFVLSAVDSRLMVLSPDPEIINRGDD